MRPKRFARHTGRLLLALYLSLLAEGAGAQDTTLIIRPGAQVGSIGFRFQHTQSFSTSELSGVLGLKSRGSLYGFRRLLGKLPLIQAPSTYRFNPIELQKDVVRLRRFYQRSGFPQASIDYDVRAPAPGLVVDVVFLIDEGPAVVLRTIEVLGLPDPPDEHQHKLRADLSASRGRRFGDAEARAVERRIAGWLQDRGYPFATVRSSRAVDSLHYAVDAILQASPGRRSRLGLVTIEGNASVSDQVILRELPFRPGDWYSAEALAEGRRQLQAITLLAQTQVAVDSIPAVDSALPVWVRVQEARPRLSIAELGYISNGAGLTGRVQWTHPNFTGGARGLATSIEVQSGIGAIDGETEQLLRGSLTFTLPYTFTSRLSLSVGPFAEYRDDWRDRSTAVGVTAALIYRAAPLSSIALQYQYSARYVYEYGFGDVSPGNVSLLRLLSLQVPSLIDSLGRDIDKSSFTLTSTLNMVDNLANPRRGWLLRPQVEIAVPSAFNTAEFARVNLTVSRFQPVNPTLVLVGQISIGRLFPFGKSVPAAGEDPTFSFIRLRDESMTAGGTNDVRGWSDRLLGPKLPNAEVSVHNADTVLVASRYIPIGALAKLTSAVELRLPAPGLSPAWGTHLFVDAGKVWTPDERFSAAPLLPEQTELRFSAGAGISYQTPAGAIRLSLAYKLNPSTLDLRPPDQVLSALIADPSAGSVKNVETDWYRRLHLHFSLGVAL